MRFKLRVEELLENAVCVRPPQPFRRHKGVLLVGRSPCASESPAPKRRVNLNDHRAIGPHAPTVERPEWTCSIVCCRALLCIAQFAPVSTASFALLGDALQDMRGELLEAESQSRTVKEL
jgi:hypothetical protein